jgi:hypothetical protein
MTPEEFQRRLSEGDQPDQEHEVKAVKKLADATMHAMCGGKIGHGTSRYVFEVRKDPTMVIKEVHLPFVGANLFELFVWNAVSATKWRPVFGECLAISDSGRYLMMERLDDIEEADHPNTPSVPVWMSDVKPENFGRTKAGLIKIRDYGMAKIGAVLSKAEGYRTGWQVQADMRAKRRL